MDMMVNNRVACADPLLAPKETAHLLGLSTSWLAKARLRGDGPRYVKLGRAVRYPESYVREFIRSRTRSSTSEH
jgi:predicted DNA-binding transcriptional regulator AlpA